MTTRRNFIHNLLVAGAAFAILPGAGRVWKAERARFIANPEWVTAPFEVRFFSTEQLARAIVPPLNTAFNQEQFWNGDPGGLVHDRFTFDASAQRYQLVPRFIRQPPPVKKPL